MVFGVLGRWVSLVVGRELWFGVVVSFREEESEPERGEGEEERRTNEDG
jgi:hypothetical protein